MANIPLLPNQIWFLDNLYEPMIHPGRWALGRAYRLNAAVTPRVAEAAVTSVWKHHDSLRVRLRRVGGEWEQQIGEPDTPAPFRSVDLSNIPAADRGTLIEQLIYDAAASIAVTGDTLVRFVFLSPGADDAPRLIFVAHHLVLDASSISVMAADLDTALASLSKGIPVSLPRGASYAECAETLHDFAVGELPHELDYWAALPWRQAVRPPARSRPVGALRPWRTRSERLAAGFPARNAGQSGTGEFILAAVGAALTEWTGGHTWVTTMHHGRDLVTRNSRRVLPARAWRTVGWFATGGLRMLPHYEGQGLEEYARSLAAAEPPNHGFGLPLMHWLKAVPGAEEMTGTIMADSQVLFNYISPRPQSRGALSILEQAPENVRYYLDLLEPRQDMSIRVRNDDNGLRVNWDFDPAVLSSDVVGQLASKTVCLWDANIGRYSVLPAGAQ